MGWGRWRWGVRGGYGVAEVVRGGWGAVAWGLRGLSRLPGLKATHIVPWCVQWVRSLSGRYEECG